MQKQSFNNVERATLKSILRALVTPAEKAEIANATIGRLVELANTYGVDIAAIRQAAAAKEAALQAGSLSPMAAEDFRQELEAEAQASALEGDAPVSSNAPDTAPNATPVEAPEDAVRRIQGLLGQGNFDGFRAAISELAKAAAKPPREVVRTVEKRVEVAREIVRREIVVQPPEGSQAAVLGLPKVSGVVSLADAWKGAKKIAPKSWAALGQRVQVELWDAPDAPAVDLDYIWPASTPAIMSQIGRQRNVMLTGPAGTGKTTLIEQIAARTGRPYVCIQCNDRTDAPDLVGMPVPGPANQGGAGWQDGQLTAAIRRPGTIIAIEEPSIARPGALFAFQSVMDGRRALFIAETGERVPVAPGVVFVLADNTGGVGDPTGAYEGTRRLNRATLDRVGATVRVGYMPEASEIAALVSRTGCTAELAALAVQYANATRASYDQGALTHGVGLRRLMAWAELVTDGVPHADAYAMAIDETAAPDDREKLREIYRCGVSDSAVSAALSGLVAAPSQAAPQEAPTPF